ncbi:MAG: class I SAM-dependent methyltransferase [Gammaproteobacteria bacterium]|nr:class I SAM-dependent methyltransferase [Gammaproteobacteria bacterium]
MFPKFAQGLKKTFQHHSFNRNDTEAWQQFQFWYASELGRRLAQSEKEILDKYLPDLFGYYLLQCGCPEIRAEKVVGKWFNSSRVSSQYCLDYQVNQGVSCQACFNQLPIKSDSLDIVILPHVLEFSSESHQILREVDRVLIAEGHVVILGFNPWSIWNIWRLFLFWTKQAPWNAQFLAASRVMDWLALLGFDVIHRQGYFYKPPIQNGKILKKMRFLDKLGQRFWPKFGAGYVLVARKRVQTLTPIRPRWRAQPKVVSGGFETINRNKM